MGQSRRSFIGVLVFVSLLMAGNKGKSSTVMRDQLNVSEDIPEFYDEAVFRTINLEFSQPDWWSQLELNYGTEENILADLIVDDIIYPDVGVRFKGDTSYRNTRNSQKKSFNIEINHTHPDQRLMGYRTLNLHNAYNDPSFMREVLYSNISRKYIPSPRANFVKLIINGESWGVYANVQQVNADLIDDWFQSSDGTRWRAEGGMGGGPPGGGPGGGGMGSNSALTWLGSEITEYEAAYDVRSNDSPEAWTSLITVCDILNNTPLESLKESLWMILDIDRALWNIAVENIFSDEDGYINKGSDYFLYLESETGRLHLLQNDGNEVLGATNRIGAETWSPFKGEADDNRPLIKQLLSVPELRQRYLAHMRTLIKEAFDITVLEPKIEEYRLLITDDVMADTKKLYSNDYFEKSITDILNFIRDRRDYLLTNIEVNRQAPEIISVTHNGAQEKGDSPYPGQAVQVTAETGTMVGIEQLILHYAEGPSGLFSQVAMYDDGTHGDGTADDGIFRGKIPSFAAGTLVRYYVEARASDDAGTITFAPPGAEHDVFSYYVQIPVADSTPIVINELVAVNETTNQDPQGEYDDWIELLNISDDEVDLSDMYLSDKQDNPRKWQFPEGTSIPPGGYLLIWADEDGSDEPGLHANFKLSMSGETVMLIDADERDNALLDSVVFGEQSADVSYGRIPDGTGDFQPLTNPTPGGKNVSSTAACFFPWVESGIELQRHNWRGLYPMTSFSLPFL